MARLEANSIKGLIPALDRKKVTQPFVVDGKNFIVDVEGAKSGAGADQTAENFLAEPRYTQSFITDADTKAWIFTQGAILRPYYDEQQLEPVYVFTEPVEKQPWSHALVGGKHYFARRDVGLIEYDPLTDAWLIVDGVTYGANIPDNIVACTESDGRLVVLAQGLVAWSTVDDGSDFALSTATGAGAQSLSILGSYSLDSVIGIYKVVDGFITMTRDGMMKSTITRTIIVFRHRVLSKKYVPVNAWSVVQDRDDSIIYLAIDGLYKTEGDIPKLWQPLMSEYLRIHILDVASDTSEGIFKLQYLLNRDYLIVHYAENAQKGIYTKAWMLAIKIDEWFSFDEVHTSICECRAGIEDD